MKSVFITPEIRRQMGGLLLVGFPIRKPLAEYIYTLDLDAWSILVSDPVDVRNVLAAYTKWTSDRDTRGLIEHWPQSVADVERILETKRDDCDGIASTAASILHSAGNDNARLVLGGYKDPGTTNHAWVHVHDPDRPADPFVVDACGDDRVETLPRLSDLPAYAPLVSAQAGGKEWIHGAYAENFG